MSQRALLLRIAQRFVAPPIEGALNTGPRADFPVVPSTVMEKRKKVEEKEEKEKMEHETKRALEETGGEQAEVDEKAERLVQEGKRKAEDRKRNEQKEQEESQREEGEKQTEPLKAEDEQSKAKLEQAVRRAMEPDVTDDLVTEMPIGYNDEFDLDEGVPLVSADEIRESSPVPEHVVTAVLCPHGYANPEDCPICREEIKEELREVLQHL